MQKCVNTQNWLEEREAYSLEAKTVNMLERIKIALANHLDCQQSMHQPPRNTDVDWIMIDAKHVIIGLKNRIKELEEIVNQSHGTQQRRLELKTGMNVLVTPNEVDKLINHIDGPEYGHVHQISASKTYAWIRLDNSGEDKVFAIDQLTILDD